MNKLESAIENNDLIQVQEFINNGIYVDSILDFLNNTPLMLASILGRKEIVEFLLDKEADVNLTDIEGNTALNIAASAEFSSPEIVELLINAGSDVNTVNSNGNTPLMRAALSNNKEIFKILLENNADKSIKNKDGKTVYEYARREIKDLLPTDPGFFIEPNYRAEFKEYCDDKFYKKCLENKGYSFEKFLGGGAQGCVYAMCSKELCDYAAKIQPMVIKGFPNHDPQKELELIKSLKDSNIVPKIFDEWTCTINNNKYIVFIMEELDGNIDQLLNEMFQLKNRYFKGIKPTQIEKNKLKKNLIISRYIDNQIDDVYKKLVNNGIYYMDWHNGNVMYKINDDGSINILLPDFGIAETDPQYRDKDKEKFNKFRKEYRSNLRKFIEETEKKK